MTRIRSRRDFVVLRDPASTETAEGTFNGRPVNTARGATTAGGIILLDDRIATSKTCHEMEVVAVREGQTPDLTPGDRVIVFLGGDANPGAGISAFPGLDGTEHAVVPAEFIWARVRDGEILPRGRVVLTERDDVAFKRYTFGRDFSYELHETTMAYGLTASGDEDPTKAGARTRDSVTALYERVYRTGPDVKDLARGQVVCFSPSYSATMLKRAVDGKTRFFHLVDSDEIYYEVE